MFYVIFIIFFLLQFVSRASTEGQYTIVAPSTISSYQTYSISVAIHQATELCRLKFLITGPSYNETKEIVIAANELKTVDFHVPTLWVAGDYELLIEGEKGVVFTTRTKLNYKKLIPFLMFHMDKSIYDAGDIVKIFVIFLDEYLRLSEPLNDTFILIRDDNGNIAKKIYDFDLMSGYYMIRYELSEFSNLKKWYVDVCTPELCYDTMYFKVRPKQQLGEPIYVMSIDVPDHIIIPQDNDEIQGTIMVDARYGEPFNGFVKLSLKLNAISYIDSDYVSHVPNITYIDRIRNGRLEFRVNIESFRPYINDTLYSNTLRIIANAEDHFTAKKLYASRVTKLRTARRYAVECVSGENCKNLRAGMTEEVIIEIRPLEGSILNNNTNSTTANLYYTDMSANKQKYEFESVFNTTSGEATFEVQLTPMVNSSQYYNMELEYDEEVNFVNVVYAEIDEEVAQVTEEIAENSTATPAAYFEIYLADETQDVALKVNEKYIFTVNSSVPLTYFIYHLIGRGNLVHSERIELTNESSLFNLTITATDLMTPKGFIYVYYMDVNNDLYYTTTTFDVHFQLRNKLEVSGPQMVQQSENVSLIIETEPNSIVGLQAIDTSFYNADRDITKSLRNYYKHFLKDVQNVITLTNEDSDDKEALVESGEDIYSDIDYFELPTSAVMDMEEETSFGHGKNNWIFDIMENSTAHTLTWTGKVPNDVLTDWLITGFSLNHEQGLGLIQQQAMTIKVSRPFYVSIDLPYSIKKDEIIKITVFVYNLLDKYQEIDITLASMSDLIRTLKVTKILQMPANAQISASFTLRPKVIGDILLKFSIGASSLSKAIDIYRTLKVVPMGLRASFNHAYFVPLNKHLEFEKSLALEIGSEIAKDSIVIQVDVMGDLLAPLMENLEQYIELPTANLEQIAANLMLNCLILSYLEVNKRLTPMIEMTLKRKMETQYQSLFSGHHTDGSFSYFGTQSAFDSENYSIIDEEDDADAEYDEAIKQWNKDANTGSTWLTAYILRVLRLAKPYIFIDEKFFKHGLNYLLTRQTNNFSFVESNKYQHDAHNSHDILTANVLLTFHENKELVEDMMLRQIYISFGYIYDSFFATNDLYRKSLIAYTLHRAGRTGYAASLIGILVKSAKTDGENIWWSQRDWSNVKKIKTTAYMLLILLDLQTERLEDLLPIAKWLLAQRNRYGGFVSAEDTLLATQALIKFMQKFSERVPWHEDGISVSIKCNNNETSETFKVNNDNAMYMQWLELSQDCRLLNLYAKGSGLAVVQIFHQYHIQATEDSNNFRLDVSIYNETAPFRLELEICFAYVGERSVSNMAILEISLPTAYKAEYLSKSREVQYVQEKFEHSMVIVHLDKLERNINNCLFILAYKIFNVVNQQSSKVVLYDYGNTAERVVRYYTVSSKICHICKNNAKCSMNCK